MAGWPWGWFPWWGRAWKRGGGPGCAAFSPAGRATAGPDAHSSAAPSDRTCWTSWWLSLLVRSLLLILHRWLRKVFIQCCCSRQNKLLQNILFYSFNPRCIYIKYIVSHSQQTVWDNFTPPPPPQYVSYFYSFVFFLNKYVFQDNFYRPPKSTVMGKHFRSNY